MTDEEVELVDTQQTDNDADNGSRLNLQVLTFLLVAATFVWVTGTPTLQETTTQDWKIHSLQKGQKATVDDGTCYGTKTVERTVEHRSNLFIVDKHRVAKSDNAACFEREKYRLKQLELYGHRLTYNKQPESLAAWKEGMARVDIAG